MNINEQKNEMLFSENYEKLTTNHISKIRHEINNQLGFLMPNNGILLSYLGKINEYIGLLVEFKELYRNDALISEMNDCIKNIEKVQQKYGIDKIMQDIPAILKDEKEGFVRIKETVESTKEIFKEVALDEIGEVSNLNDCISSCVATIRNSNAEIRVELDLEEMSDIKIIPPQIQRAMLNIMMNSVDAIKRTGRLDGRISITSYLSANFWGHQIVCEIEDNGIGIPEEYLNKIFEEKFTTKEDDQNTGFGLAIAKEIIQDNHNGSLTCKSSEGVGSKFTITLPITEK